MQNGSIPSGEDMIKGMFAPKPGITGMPSMTPQGPRAMTKQEDPNMPSQVYANLIAKLKEGSRV